MLGLGHDVVGCVVADCDTHQSINQLQFITATSVRFLTTIRLVYLVYLGIHLFLDDDKRSYYSSSLHPVFVVVAAISQNHHRKSMEIECNHIYNDVCCI